MESIKVTTETQVANAITWIEALNSEKYLQGKNRMGDAELGFCCWGLGCHVVEIPFKYSDGWNQVFAQHIGFLEESGVVHSEILDPKSCVSLADLNDNRDWTFKQIGDFLTKNAHFNFKSEVAEAIKQHFS